MRTTVASLVALFISVISVGVGAAEDEITITGIARSASAFAAMRTICSKFFPVDAKRAEQYERAISAAGVRDYGDREFKSALKSELDRRLKEIQITGSKQWCAYQRDHLEKIIPDRRLFPTQTRSISADDMAMLLATLLVAQNSCGMKTTDAPVNVAVARYGFDLVDFLPDGLYAPVVEVKIRKAHEFIEGVGQNVACNGLIETLQRFLPEVVSK